MGSLDFLMNQTIALTSCGACCGKSYPCDKCVASTLRANGLPEKLASKVKGLSHHGSGMSEFEFKIRDLVSAEKKKTEVREEKAKQSSFFQYKKQYDDLHEPLMESLRKGDEKEKKRIMAERERINAKLEKAYGKHAYYRKAPIHRTHQMEKWHGEMLAPCGTPRFYSVRNCKRCGAEEAHHSAGHFVDKELYEPCTKKGHRS